jgi:hypothetical protein
VVTLNGANSARVQRSLFFNFFIQQKFFSSILEDSHFLASEFFEKV